MKLILAYSEADGKLKDGFGYPGTTDYVPLSNLYIPNASENPIHPEVVDYYASKGLKGEPYKASPLYAKPIVIKAQEKDFPQWEKLNKDPLDTDYPELFVMDGVHRVKAAEKNGKKEVEVKFDAKCNYVDAQHKVKGEQEKYPYFHVTDFAGVPNKPNIYLGIKGEKYSKESYGWDNKKYFWSAQLKPNIKLYNPDEKWDLSGFSAAASAMGFNEDFLESSTDSDISFYRELIQEKGKFEDLDDLVDQRPQYGFHILKAFSEKGLFSYLQHKGYQGIYDKQGKYLYEAADLTDEPQILIFNLADIIWGDRTDNEDFHKRTRAAYLRQEKNILAYVGIKKADEITGNVNTLDAAINSLKEQWSDYGSGYLNLNNPQIEQEIREDLTDIWKKPLYRMVRTKTQEIDKKRLGIFWTYNKDRAKAYWGEGEYLALLTTHVAEKDIDWVSTVEQHLKPKYAAEDEVRLHENAVPKLVDTKWMNEANAEQFDDAQIPPRTAYPPLEEPAPKTDGTYPTRYSVDKLMFQASSDLPFKPTAKEVLEVANYVRSPTLKEQLTALVGEVCLAAQDEFPKAGSTVDGRKVGSTISNLESISATLTDWEELPGIREISMSDWEADPHKLFYSKSDIDRCKKLAAEIEHSKRIDPLIVVKDKDGLYVLEGGHRLGALHLLKAKSFPALVVIDTEDRAVEAKTSLKGLEAEAAKYKTFEEFKKAFSVDIKHGIYWHVTADPDFKIDPAKGPRDMSSMSNGKPSPGKLMITSHLEYWTDYYGKDRPYAAEIDMSEVDPKDYQQVARGFGNEFWVENPAKAKVVKVYKVQQALRRNAQYHSKLPNSDKELRQIFDKVAEKVHVR